MERFGGGRAYVGAGRYVGDSVGSGTGAFVAFAPSALIFAQ